MLRSLRARPRWFIPEKVTALTALLRNVATRRGSHMLLLRSSSWSNEQRHEWSPQSRGVRIRSFGTSSVKPAQDRAGVQSISAPTTDSNQITKDQIHNVDLAGWETIIGLEIHAQLKTSRKLFSCTHLYYCHRFHVIAETRPDCSC